VVGAPDLSTSLAWFGLFMMFCTLGFAAAVSSLMQVTAPRMRGVVAAGYLFRINIVGLGLGSALPGILNDAVFGSEQALGLSLRWIAAIAAPSAFVLLWSARGRYIAAQRTFE
jgi:MFS family permease